MDLIFEKFPREKRESLKASALRNLHPAYKIILHTGQEYFPDKLEKHIVKIIQASEVVMSFHITEGKFLNKS